MIRTIVIALAILVAVPVAAERQTLVVGIGCMENCVQTQPGFEAFFKELYSRAGLDVKFKYIPMLRDITEANDLTIDATFARTPVAVRDYPNLDQVPFPLVRYSLVAATMRPVVRATTWKDLKPLRVGLIRGNRTTLLLLEEHIINFTLFNHYENGLAMLREGRFDVIVDDAMVLSQMADSLGYTNVSYSEPLATGFYYHYVNRVHQRLVPRLARSMRKMLEDGTSARLLGPWAVMLPDPSEVPE